MIIRVLIVFILGVSLYIRSSAYADVTILSINALHLGYGKDENYKDEKYKRLREFITKKNADLTLFQEVMSDDVVDRLPKGPGDLPNHYQLIPEKLETKHFKGINQGNSRAYVEAYLSVANTKNIKVLCHVSLKTTDISNGANLARPPDLILFAKGNAPQWTVGPIWVVNFHAVWGNSLAERINELKILLDYLSTTLINAAPSSIGKDCKHPNSVNKVVLAGDFNLSFKQIRKVIEDQFSGNSFQQYGWRVEQDKETTLNLKGLLRSNYDHFLLLNIPTSDVIEIGRIMEQCDRAHSVPVCLGYRESVSDHIGVFLKIK